VTPRGLWSEGVETIIDGTSRVTLLRDAIAPDDEIRLLAAIIDGLVWREDHIVIHGVRHAVPRLQAWVGDPDSAYAYSGIALDPAPWTDPVLELRRLASEHAGVDFNSVLVNRYRTGDDALAWHADDEPELGPEPVIAGVSLGATRRFRLRRRDDHATSIGLDLPGGSLLVMAGRTQVEWEHCVPRTARPVGERLNLTFRCIARP
jgi:alkylated DNA repair dioxygenase AlkB